MVSQDIAAFAQARVGDGELEYCGQGSGEPVLLIHGSIIAEGFAPLLAQAALAGRYRLICYHRRGFAGSSRTTGPFSIAQQAADARALLDCLGIERAHVAGHSYGGLIALQLALDAPRRVHSLALLEPGFLWCERPAEAAEALEPIARLYEAGDMGSALESFGEMVAGPRFREAIDRALAQGWFEQAIADIDTFFQVELPAMLDWRFTPEMAARISTPALSVLGGESAAVDPWAVEEHDLLQQWLPRAEALVVPGVTHALQLMDPAAVAEGLAGFLERHPLARAS
jgi:3-oxoadipate enol-lactonase